MSIYNARPGGGSSSGYALVALASDKSSISLDVNKTSDTFTITYEGDGDLTVTSSNTSIATVALVSGKTYRVTAGNNKQGSVTIIAKATVGEHTIPVNEVEINVTVDTIVATNVLNDNDWDVISAVSQAGQVSNYWAVGDRKAVTLNGTIGGNLTLSNTTLYVYILGINHNGSTGITFGGFKNALAGGADVALCDSGYNSEKTSGTWFNMNNSRSNAGGWAKCRMRYYVLGSTDSSSGDNASSTTATSPVSNTLMSALPSALRAVMKPMTVYSDNRSSSTTSVSATTDYLPLLAEYEVFGSKTYAATLESSNGIQAQYQYYKNGNSKVKYKHNATSTSCIWWLRSTDASSAYGFCFVGTGGSASNYYADYSYGIAPIFLV